MIKLKSISILLLLFLTLYILLCGCNKKNPTDTSASYGTEYSYGYSETVTDDGVSENESTTEQESTLPEESVTGEYTVTEAPSTECVTDVSQPVTEQKTTAETTQAQPTTQPAKSPVENTTSVDLSITLPEANGKMHVDTSSGNKFIAAVVNARKLNPELLAAVYSLPESGQNYVFEFGSAGDKSKDNLKKVYLLDNNCNITSVAAKKSSDRENISQTENWFCFNVLIKGVIFDALADKFG